MNRHTFDCQLLSTGAIPAEWISQQLGHTNTMAVREGFEPSVRY